MRKIMGIRSSLSITVKGTSRIMCNPLSEYVYRGVMHNCASIIFINRGLGSTKCLVRQVVMGA